MLTGWLFTIIAIFSYFVSARLVEFDPNGTLSKLRVDEVKDAVFQSSHSSKLTENTLYHISQSHCPCNEKTAAHIVKINQQAKLQGISIHYMALTQAQLSSIPEITATPAVLFVGKKTELVYLGPYAQGLACSETAGMIDITLRNYQKGFNNQIVFSNAQGCYCLNASS